MSSDVKTAAPQFIPLEPAQPFWLEHSDTFWQVWQGRVEVYAVSAASSRRFQQTYLFTVEEGQPLFGIPFHGDTGIRLMAQSPGGAELKTMSRAGLLGNACRSGRHIFEVIWFMIEEWLDVLLSSPDVVAPPRIFSLLAAGQTLSLAAGQSVRTGKEVIWARRQSGELRYGRLPDYCAPPDMVFPITQLAWVRAATAAEISGLTTDQMFPPTDAVDTDTFWKPLDDCHQLFSEIIAQFFADQVRRDRQRLVDRRGQREKLLHNAATHLLRHDITDVSIFATADSSVPPILLTLRRIAGYLGLAEETVRLPKDKGNALGELQLINQIAHLAGLQMRKVQLQQGWHEQDNGPLLAYYGPERQPAALLPVSPRSYQLYLPGEAVGRTLTPSDLSAIQPQAYTFYASLLAKSVTLSEWIKFSLKKCWPQDYVSIVLTSLIAGMIPMLTPFVTNTIFSDLIPIADRHGHVMVIQVMMVAALASTGVSLTRGIAVMRLKGRTRLAAEAALWLRMLSLPSAFFRKYEAGDLALRLNSINTVSMVLSNSTVSTIFNGILSVFSLAMMLYYSWKLGLISVLLLLLYVSVVCFLVWKMIANKRQMMEAAGKVAGQVLQLLNGLAKFRMQGAEPQAFYLWAKDFGAEWKWNRAVRWNSNWLEVVNSLQPVLLSMLIFYLTMYWLEAGDKEKSQFISQADFLSFNSAMSGFNAAVIGMIPVFSQLMDLVPTLERLKPILETAPEVSEEKIEAGELTGRVEVNNLSFRYAPEKPLVLENISMTIKPGQFVAIVGSSGSGKSTLLRLLLGFEQPETGAVYFDGQDLAEISVKSVRSQMGVVLQHGQLMAGDIYGNIVGSLPLSIDDAWVAAEMVGLADDIRAMPMGMHTMISEGASNISGGQRQRVLIARSIVNRPRIIVFDEATSALDNRTQAIVTESLEKLKATRIIVAHRLSTICNADYIYVLDKGKIAESGTFEQLMKHDGIFASMAKRQLA